MVFLHGGRGKCVCGLLLRRRRYFETFDNIRYSFLLLLGLWSVKARFAELRS